VTRTRLSPLSSTSVPCPSGRSSGTAGARRRLAARRVALLSAPLLVGLSASLGCGDTIDALEGGDAFTNIYESEPFQKCSGCHAPDAPGRTNDIEKTQDWSTRDTAHSTLKRTASGMIGNFADCNGVAFIGASAEQSLLVASLDFDVRMNFEDPAHPDCTGDAISDQSAKVGGVSDSLIQDLKDWIDSGAP
jgi:hypothetical protein